MVCDPVSSAAIEVGLPVSGSAGRPSETVSSTVPVSAGAWPSATAASSWAGVRGGSTGRACHHRSGDDERADRHGPPGTPGQFQYRKHKDHLPSERTSADRTGGGRREWGYALDSQATKIIFMMSLFR